MKQPKIILFFALLFLSNLASANFRIVGGIGLGSTTSSNEISQIEGPFIQAFSVEFVQHSNLMLGAEQIRSLSLSPMSTANSFTGILANFYFSSIPTRYEKADGLNPNHIIYRDLGFFVGTGLGMAQSSRIPDENGKTSNSAGIYISPKAGIDFQLTNNFGLRGELVTAMTIMGQGTISAAGLIGNIYWIF